MDFDPEAYLTTEVAPPPEVPIITDELRRTEYGPSSPNPTPADLKEYIGNANNPLQTGDVALPRDIADKYGLKTGDPFIYQGQTWHYADTPNPRVGNVIDVYHPSGEFNPHEYITPPQPSGLPSGVEHGTSGGPEFNPQAYLEPVPSEATTPQEEQQRSPIQISPGEAPPIPQVTTNVPQFIPQTIGGVKPIPQVIAQIPRPPQPSPSGPPSPPTQGPGAIGQFMALPPVLSPQQARTGLDTALALAAPQASQQLFNLQQTVPGAAPVVEGVKNSLANTVSSVTAPGTMTLAPALAIPGVAEAWGAYQIAKTPQAMANVADVIKRYGIASKESASAITDEATRLAMAGTALRKPIMAVSREIAGTAPFAGQVNEPPPSTFGRAGIERASVAGAVPQPSETHVLPEGAVKGSGRYAKAGRVNKEAMDNINALAASRESAQLLANTRALYVIGKLSSEQITDLGKYLVSERLKTVNPDHPQILDNAETARIANDPKIAAAIERYANVVKPEIEGLRLKAGLKASSAEGKARTFVSLVPTTDELLPAAIPPSAGTLASKSKTTVFARHAEGYAKEYETNLAKILDRSYTEVMPKARLFDTYQSLKKNGLISQESVKEIKGQPAVKTHWVIPGMDNNARLPDFSYVPAQIAGAIRDAVEKAPDVHDPVLDAIQTYQRFATGAALTANPLAAGNHMRRQFGVLARTPPKSMPASVQVLEALPTWFGPQIGTAIRAFTRNASTPEFKAIMQKITDANAGSTRAFAQYQATGKVAQTIGLTKLQQLTHELLFGIPEGEGIKGFDWRLRVQGEIERMAAEPDAINDMQRVREVANRLGEYSSHPSMFVQKTKKLVPFSATTVPVRVSEIKQLFGGAGFKSKTGMAAAEMRAQTVLRGLGGTLVMFMAANKFLSGHYPWQNQPGNAFKIETNMYDEKGKLVTYDLSYLDAGITRALKTLSIPQIVGEALSGAYKKSYLAAAGVGPFNALASTFSSPLLNIPWTALSGTVPYLMRGPGEKAHFLDVAKGPTSDRGLNSLLAAIANINPVGEMSMKYGPKMYRNYVEQQPPLGPPPANVVRAHVVRPNVVKANVVRAKVRR